MELHWQSPPKGRAAGGGWRCKRSHSQRGRAGSPSFQHKAWPEVLQAPDTADHGWPGQGFWTGGLGCQQVCFRSLSPDLSSVTHLCDFAEGSLGTAAQQRTTAFGAHRCASGLRCSAVIAPPLVS